MIQNDKKMTTKDNKKITNDKKNDKKMITIEWVHP